MYVHTLYMQSCNQCEKQMVKSLWVDEKQAQQSVNIGMGS